MEANKNAIFDFERACWNNITVDCKKLIRGMLEKDPEMRVGYKDILENPYIKEIVEKN